MTTAEESRAAAKRGREMRKNVPHATAARYDSGLHRVLIRLSNRLEIALNPDDHQALHKAATEDLSEIELWGAGYEVFFPRLDEGVSLPALIQGILGSKAWMEEQAKKDRKQFSSKRTCALKKKTGIAA